MENAHIAQRANFHRSQFQTFHGVSLRKLPSDFDSKFCFIT
jgi:hypothetical protein